MADQLLAVDVGGTFTDGFLLDRRTQRSVQAKAPTTPEDRTEGVIEAAQRVLAEADVQPAAVDRVLHGTTTATNALLEGEGARTALVTNEGFEDVLEIGRQARPSLYDLDQAPPEPIVPRRSRFGVSARIDADGTQLVGVDEDEIASLGDELAATDVEAVAVGLLHAHRSAEHEQAIAEQLRERLGEIPVVTSAGTSPEPREVERLSTTVVNATLRPLVGDYLRRLEDRLADIGVQAPIRVLDSAGAAVPPREAATRPVNTVLSGPAGGAAANRQLAEQTGTDPLVGVDMGGTSTDVSLVQAGEVATRWRLSLAGRPLQIPAVDVRTIGAGGGSIASRDEAGGLQVGPDSAGAQPGPACYARGGEQPTVTDANLVLDRIPPSAALAGELSLDEDRAREAIARLGEASVEQLARQILEIAVARTSRGLRRLVARHAVDPAHAGLAAFGGAGPQFGPAWARRLGFAQAIVPPRAGVTSAEGLLAAPARVERSRGLLVRVDELTPERFEQVVAELADEARRRLPDRGEVETTRLVSARYAGQSHELTVPVQGSDPQAIASAFHDRHEAQHGYTLDEPVEVVTVRVRAQGPPLVGPGEAQPSREGEPERVETVQAWFVDGDEPHPTPVYRGSDLGPGMSLAGPAIVSRADTTAIVPPDAEAHVHGSTALVVTWGDQR